MREGSDTSPTDLRLFKKLYSFGYGNILCRKENTDMAIVRKFVVGFGVMAF